MSVDDRSFENLHSSQSLHPKYPISSLRFQTQTQTEDKRTPQINYDSLADFLKRVTPGVLDLLDETHGSNAFDDYDPGAAGESSAVLQIVERFDTLEASDFKVTEGG